jgi:hypothetical protein
MLRLFVAENIKPSSVRAVQNFGKKNTEGYQQRRRPKPPFPLSGFLKKIHQTKNRKRPGLRQNVKALFD